ncbi:MAG: class I SAM-dependent methyltransferase [Candidatus Woesearchaeota archaeon]|nr:class I SAM-dependent methyltransferase [Candidatus Woesearchaeota archaeon]
MKNMKVMDKETQNLLDYWEGESEIAAKRPPYSNHAVMDMFDKYIDLKGKKVLDVGCGYGNIFRLMKQRGAEPYGLDICPECIDNLKKLGFSGKVGDCREIPYKSNTFDVVYSIGVVEHFDETDQSIAEHIRVCKPGGKVIVMVPHLNPLYTPLAVLHPSRCFVLSLPGQDTEI